MTGATSLSRRGFVRRLAVVAATSVSACRWAFGAEAAPAAMPVQKAMDRAAKCCLAWLNPEEGFLPTGGYEVAHDMGRWWDAMLRYELATGIGIPAQVEEAMLRNLRMLTDNAAALLTSNLCNPHNLRESLLAYTALARHRRSDWALAQGRKLVNTIASLLDADGQLDYVKLAELTAKPLTDNQLMMHRSPAGQWFSAAGSTGRALEAIVWFHEVSGDDSSLQLAKRLAELHLRNIIDPSGEVRAELLDPKHVGHTHSYFGTLRGLLLYGLTNGVKEYVEAVANTYRQGIWDTAKGGSTARRESRPHWSRRGAT